MHGDGPHQEGSSLTSWLQVLRMWPSITSNSQCQIAAVQNPSVVSALPCNQGSSCEGFHTVSQFQPRASAVIHTRLTSYRFQTAEKDTARWFHPQPAPEAAPPAPFLAAPAELMGTAAELLSPGYPSCISRAGTAFNCPPALLLFTGVPQPPTPARYPKAHPSMQQPYIISKANTTYKPAAEIRLSLGISSC